MKHAATAKALLCSVLFSMVVSGFTPTAQAAIYVAGSVSATAQNVPFQTYESRYGSASLSFDIFSFIRIGYTHSQEFKSTEAYSRVATEGDATAAVEDKSCAACVHSFNSTLTLANSVDLTLILYQGDVVVPYLMAGAIVKTYKFTRQLENGPKESATLPSPPVPNLGAGVGIRLNKDFTLKLSYIASPGQAQLPGEIEARSIWDKNATVGLSYQL